MSKKIISLNFSSSRRPSMLEDFKSYLESRKSLSYDYEAMYRSFYEGYGIDEDYWDDINALYGYDNNVHNREDLAYGYSRGSSSHNRVNSEYYDEDGNYISRRESIKKKSRARHKSKKHRSHSYSNNVEEMRLNDVTGSWEVWNSDRKCWELSDGDISPSDDIGTEMKKILFYEDIHEEPKSFGNLFELDSYLTSEGIETPESEMGKLINNYEIHCCINPSTLREHGDKVLISDTSYGNLRWSINDNDYDVI